ncbi:MAG TPA: Lrp/AsnC family transcriptional regulator [Clostridia bacterium]|jgi:DNA-binding Lrp family transcriptional regulator|nr:Lrp/AsnC family transcriptional regulator [Clostridia bacterium]
MRDFIFIGKGVKYLRKAILKILEDNCRLSAPDIAKMLGIDKDTVANEIKVLEKERVILSYGALINWEKTDEEVVSALIDVKVTPQRDVGFDQVAERIQRYPEVKALYLMSGSYDLSVLVEGKNLKAVSKFVAEKLASMDNVQSTTTHFVLKRYKQDGIVFEDQHEDLRQVITP